MSERKLAHVESVVDVAPVPNSDNLDVVTVLGWRCVTKRGELKVGDKICYIEVDSIVPAIPYFSFMAERKYRVRTIKLRKQLSQGLVIPLSGINTIQEQLEKPTYAVNSLSDGDDITEGLGIVKWLTPEERSEISDSNNNAKKKHTWLDRHLTRFSWYRKMFKKKSKSFPEWISKTDEERIQNVPWVLQDETEDWYVSEKLEGQSGTYWYKKKGFFTSEFGVCSRTVRKFEHDMSNWSRVARQFEIKKNLKFISKVYGDIAIQGEVIGEGIQGNIYNLKGLDFYVFNVYNIKEKKYYPLDKAQTITRELGLKFVPVLAASMRLPKTVELCLEDADGTSILANTLREGKVYRKFDMSKSFKAVSNKYLLTKKD